MTDRLLIVSPTTGHGGAEGYMLTAAYGATKAGWDVTVGFECSTATFDLVRELRARSDVRYADVGLGTNFGRWTIPRHCYATLALLGRVRPSAMIIVLPWPNLGLGSILAAALFAIPTVVVFQLAPWRVRVGRSAILCRWAQRRRQSWVAVSDQNRGVVAESFGVSTSTIRKIYNGAPPISAPTAPEVAVARISLRDQLGVPADARVVLTIGRLEVQKGYTDLLEILPGVLRGRPDTFFVWVGDGDLRAQLESAVQLRDLKHHVRLLGYRTDVSRLLHASDLFLLPSRFEGHPFALMEAMTHRVPVISSDAGGAPEIVRAGIDGLIHRRDDSADLARHLGWALDHLDEMREMAVSGCTRVSEFSQSRMLREMLATLDELAGRRH